MRLLDNLLLPALLAAVAVLPSSATAKKNEPSIERTEFDSQPTNLFYFDDSEVVLLLEADNGQVWRTENEGNKWEKVDDIPKDGKPFAVIKNPYHDKVAVALGEHKKHWITFDRGESWKEFKTEEHPSRALPLPISFHAGDSKKMLYSAYEDCHGYICVGSTYFTDDGFESIKPLRENRKVCTWAVATDLIHDEENVKKDDRIFCVVEGKNGNIRPSQYRLVYSDNFFEDESEVKIEGQTRTGYASIAAAKKWLVAAAKEEGAVELALYTSMDAETWFKAEFGEHHVEEDAYTLLESTNYSIQVDVQSSKYADMGVLFSSNSEGHFFTRNVDNTNRNAEGFVDFEKVSNIQGVILVNVVDNSKEVDKSGAKKKVKTKLSYDDARTFHELSFKGKELHLHSVTDLSNSGRVFSSPAPGLIMGVGNTGDYLKEYNDGDLYVSDDGGLTWDLALEGAHKYEFGDQGAVLVAVYDEDATQEIRYSFKHGKDGKGKWSTVKTENEFHATELTTIPDSTSLRFIILGVEGKGRKKQWVSYTVDFTDMHERECEEDDFEVWNARVDENKDPLCVMGRKQSFRRRKADAECLVKEKFDEPESEWEVCECAEADFECDTGFRPEWSGEGEKKKKDCVPASTLTPPEGACKGDDETYKGSSGWRKIPGDMCKGGTKKDDEIERKCDETKKPPASGEITHEVTYFPAGSFREYYYIEQCETCSGDDETVVLLTDERQAFITRDHGKSWERAVEDEVVAIYPHQYYNDAFYFITPGDKVYYSTDRGDHMHEFKAPDRPSQKYQVLQFHPDPKNKDWLIWTGEEKDTVAYVSTKDGRDWKTLLASVKKCQFMYSQDGHDVDEKLVYCEQQQDSDRTKLISSENWFDDKNIVFDDVVSFATMSEFIVVASKTGEDRKNLKLDASIDGKTFADAKFPSTFNVEHQQAYTVLDSSTHSVFLHVTINARPEQEYGSIIKSNSNGTSYVLSINDVNRNADGYVDFEKMQGLEGVAVVNVVANRKQVDEGRAKQKRTLITHNDGADWDYLSPPAKDSEGNSYDCTGECYLHLHGYTERADARATYSSASAVGLMLGVGNVGNELGRIDDASTFLTQDGGITWKEVQKEAYAWEYGDQGSIIVIVKKGVPTNKVLYSINEGDSWEEYELPSKDWTFDLITTVPSDTSMNFLLFGKDGKNTKDIATVNLDFSGLFSRPCELDDDHPTDGDYELWTPKHPKLDSDCLFGHVARYHRKKRGEMCYNGRKSRVKPHDQARDEICECERRDWECDYNFERNPADNTCHLVEGLTPLKGDEVCKDKDVQEWHEITGYRKIPISKCQGGKNLRPETRPCPGFEEEFEKKHGVSGFVVFLAVILPVAAAFGVGYWVYKHWDGKFGRIRLGDGYGSFNGDNPWISWPVAAVSGLIAVLAAVPLLIGSLWRSVSGQFGSGGYGSRTYRSRSSFARGRGDYAIVDPDEGELLGDDSDDDM